MHRKRLAVCAIFENVAAHLPEWLAYHSVVGVEHFVLYDNDSVDDPARAVRGLPLAEHVTLIRWRQRPGQLAAYRHFIDIFAPGFEWAAFLGVEDRLLPLSGSNVLSVLDSLDSAAAVVVSRRVFSPAPSFEPPSALVIETYGRRAGDDFPANRHVRMIARCRDLQDVGSLPHEFRVNGSVFDAAGRLTPNAVLQDLPCYRNLVVNHYCVGSRDAWLERVRQDYAAASGDAAAAAAGVVLAELSQVQDNGIRAFAPAVRSLLGLEPVDMVPLPYELAAADVPTLDVLATAEPDRAATARPDQAAGAAAEPQMVEGFQPSASAGSGAAAVAGLAAAVPAFDVGAITAPALPLAGDPGPAEQMPPPAAAVATPVGPRWRPCGVDALERIGGTGLVFRDRSRPGEYWLAALRGAAAAGIDPAFLMDDFDRIREFPNADEARVACEAALSGQGRA
ncbi:MAG TPA: glycosyltransferase family 2 protein [Acetobacteraceae bacterium]|nr:glycosyltransferase family 2 protein [Acetobacteraceae bacterium]